jgi:hypothetical protein
MLANRGDIRPLVYALGALITAGVIIVIAAVLLSPVFSGPQIQAVNLLAERTNEICGSPVGTKETVPIVVPDSIGTTPLNLKFFFFVVEDNELRLMTRTFGQQFNDILQQFIDWVRGRPGESIVKTNTMRNCKDKEICGQFISEGQTQIFCNTAGPFAFEPQEGYESMIFTIEKQSVGGRERILLTYNRDTLCGDNRCCPPEDNVNSDQYCERDCTLTDKCAIFTA